MVRSRRLSAPSALIPAITHAGVSAVRRVAPPYGVELVERVRTRRPRAYRDKVIYKILHDRRPILVTYADKLAAKEYAAARLPAAVLPSVLAVADRSADLPWHELPREFVCKVNHGSGGMVLVSEHAPRGNILPDPSEQPGWSRQVVHPDDLDVPALAALTDYWLAMRYGQDRRGLREWAYAEIPRRAFVEELCPSTVLLPREIKVYCFRGIPQSFGIWHERDSFHAEAAGRFLEYEQDEARACAGLSADQWQDLMTMCRLVSAETDLLRVDWMIAADGLRLGELTSYPGGMGTVLSGHPTLTTGEIEEALGRYWGDPGPY